MNMHSRNCQGCDKSFRVTINSKQNFCSLNCEYYFSEKSGNVKRADDLKKENSRMVLTNIPKDKDDHSAYRRSVTRRYF